MDEHLISELIDGSGTYYEVIRDVHGTPVRLTDVTSKLVDIPAGVDPVSVFCRPELITHETRAARPRAGGGEIVRGGIKAADHVCEKPDLLAPALKEGAVWRCDCGRRWIITRDAYRSGAHGTRTWVRRFWPWPR